MNTLLPVTLIPFLDLLRLASRRSDLFVFIAYILTDYSLFVKRENLKDSKDRFPLHIYHTSAPHLILF